MRKAQWHVFVVFLFSAYWINSSLAQSGSSTFDATQHVAQMQSALWGTTPVHSIQMTSSATLHAGSEVEQGTATLTATSAGAYTVQLSLGGADRQETATAIETDRECQWTGADGVAHSVDYFNCLKPLVWFLPGITLQSGQIPASVGVNDLGSTTTQSGTYLALQSQTVIDGLTSSLLQQAMTRSTMTLDLDPSTMLPGELHYSLHPDNGANTDIHVRVLYSDYHKVGTAEIPFRIQRFINGSLQLDLEVNSANIS